MSETPNTAETQAAASSSRTSGPHTSTSTPDLVAQQPRDARPPLGTTPAPLTQEQITMSIAPHAETAGHPNDDLVVQHMGLVGHIVRETMSRVPAHVNRDDLHSAGLTALVKAGRSFEAERGVPFVRYAASRIRGAILDELRSVDWASRSVRRRSRDLDQTRSRLATELGRAPENTEVAAALGISLAEIESNDEDVARANVLSLQGSAESESSFAEVLPSTEPSPEDLVEHQERLDYMVDAIQELPERLQAVVRGYFLEERPMAEIAEELGVSESRISQMRAEALVLLRDAMNSALDPELVPAHPRPDGCAAQRRDAYFRAVADRHAAGRRPAHPAFQAAG